MNEEQVKIEPLNLNYKPFPNPDICFQAETDGSAVLVSFDSGHSISLNSVGRFIWQAANGDSTVAEIIGMIREHYEDVPDSVSEDVLEMVQILKLNGYFGEEIIIV